MDGKERYEKQLREEGFADVYTWTDAPNAYYDEHTHESLSAHIIIEGQMELKMDGKTHVCGPGDRVDVPAKTVHTAKMGPEGCTYVVGEA